jgi:DNA-binding NarL/FixJ family response regulator
MKTTRSIPPVADVPAPAPTDHLTLNGHSNGNGHVAPHGPARADPASAKAVIVLAASAALCQELDRCMAAAGYSCRWFLRMSEAADTARGAGPACVVVGLTRRDSEQGIEAIRALALSNPRLRVVVVAETGDAQTILSAMRAGARDYLVHPLEPGALTRSVQWQFEEAQAEIVRQRPPVPTGLSTLTDRECEVLDRVIRGYSTKQIAAQLGRVEKTVEYHRKRIMEKLGVSTAVQLVRLVTLHGWTA